MSAKNKSKNASNEAAANSAANTAPKSGTKVSTVKGIKNSLFADLEIGQSVRVAGVIRQIATKSGNYGDYTQFKGEFALRNHKGELFKAGTLYLPEVASDILRNGFISASEAAGEGVFPKVEFKFDLSKVADDDKRNARGYKWAVETLMEAAPESDRVLALLA
jgi:hypothetical protein